MPRFDGTGPMGAGAMTGRGLGVCRGARAIKYGAGLGAGLALGLACRRGLGLGRGFMPFAQAGEGSQKELLQQQKAALQQQLEAIDKQLNDR